MILLGKLCVCPGLFNCWKIYCKNKESQKFYSFFLKVNIVSARLGSSTSILFQDCSRIDSTTFSSTRSSRLSILDSGLTAKILADFLQKWHQRRCAYSKDLCNVVHDWFNDFFFSHAYAFSNFLARSWFAFSRRLGIVLITIMAVSRRFVIEELHKKRIYSSNVKYSKEFRDFLANHFDRHDDESLDHFMEKGQEVVSKLRRWLGQTPAARASGKSRANLRDILKSPSHKVSWYSLGCIFLFTLWHYFRTFLTLKFRLPSWKRRRRQLELPKRPLRTFKVGKVDTLRPSKSLVTILSQP